MTIIDVLNTLPDDYVGMLAACLILAVVGKVTGQELRLTLLGVAGVLVYPHAASLVGVALIGLPLRVLDLINITRGGEA